MVYRQYEGQGWPEWSAAASIDEMSELVIDWLQGRTLVLPWHFGPPDDETSRILSPLIALNRVPGLMTDNSQPGLQNDRCRQRAFISGFAQPACLSDLATRARRAGLVVRTTARIGPDDPVITEPLADSNGLVAYARSAPVGELALPEHAASVLAKTVQPFSIHDPEWGSNRMWRQLVGNASAVVHSKPTHATDDR
jgi:hypothetical protein